MDLLRVVILFFLLAIAAGVLNLPGVEMLSLDIARILFSIFLLLFIISLIVYAVTGRRPPLP